MKYLSLLRHGKAIRSNDFPVDRDRPLAKRAQADLAVVVKVMNQYSPPVDWIVSSPARRARQTAELAQEGLNGQVPIVWDEDIYEQGVEYIMSIVGEIPDKIEHVLLVGHNPTLEQMVSGLCAGSTHHLTNSLPTSGVATVELQIMSWSQVRWGCGSLPNCISVLAC